MTGRSRRSAALKAREAIAADSSDIMSRARRDPDTSSRATLSRDPPSSPSNPSLRLTVKMPVSKLRAATGGSSRAGGRSSSANGRERFAGGEILESKRSRNVKKSYVVESDSEEEDEEMEDLGDDDEDAEAESAEDDMDLDEDLEGDEDADGDEDTEMAVLPPPILKVSKPTKEKHSITVKPAKKDVRVVATTDPSDDEELSDLESDVEEDEETMQVANDEDAEGEDEEIEVEEEEEEEEEEDELDSDDETPGGGSRDSTPDLSKLTKRQRARLDEGGSGHLLALPDGSSCPPHPMRYNILTPSQRSKSKSTSQPKNTPCAAPKWHADARTSARSAMRRRRYFPPPTSPSPLSPLPSRPPPSPSHPPFTNPHRWKP